MLQLNRRISSVAARILALALSVGVSGTALAQTPPAGTQPPTGVKVYTEEKKAPPKAGPKGPRFKLDQRSKREAMAEEKREAAIQTLLDTLEIEDPANPEYPKVLIKLADQYWQKSEDYYFLSEDEKLLKAIYDAEEAKDEAELAGVKAERDRLLGLQRQWQGEAIKTYKQIEKDHPTYKELDQVLYALGYLLSQMGEKDQGYQYYAKLILQRPNSDLVPDTYLNIGDYFFEAKNDFQQALAFYEKVKQYGDTPVLGYAIFKSGWCWFNLDDKAKALNFFYETVQWTKKAEARGLKAALDLRKEALADMVQAYSEIGAPAKALAFFKKSAPDIYIALCEALANIYYNESAYGSSNIVLESLMADVGDADPRASRYQREMVMNTYKSGDKEATRKSVLALSERLQRVIGGFPEEFKKQELGELELMLRIIGTDYHRETEKTKDKATQNLAVTMYETYLIWFPEAKDNYSMSFNTAILAYQMGEYERAARLFEKVIEMNPKGEFTSPAAYQSCMARYNLATKEMAATSGAGEKKEGDPDGYKPTTIPDREAALVKSCSRYVEFAGQGTIEDASLVPNVLYVVGSIYYEYNHFEEAKPIFITLYDKYREELAAKAFIQDAAKMLLSIFNLSSDIDNLYKWTNTFAANPAINTGKFGQLLADIQAKRDFNVCRKLEFDKKFREGGDCFMKYFEDFRSAKDGDEALARAAIMYKDARLIERALAASERLYNERSDSPMAPQALYNIGQIYQAIAVYSEAAYYYEIYAQNHPDHDQTLLARALARAATYRRALGEYDKAIKDYVEFYKRFPKNADAGDIYFEIGLIYESQGNWKAVVKHFQTYLKNHGKDAKPGNVIAARTKMGIAHWKSGSRKPALDEFAQALSIFRELNDKAKIEGTKAEITEGGLDSVAAAKFYEGEVVLDEMKKVELKLPQKVFAERLAKKLELISQATDRMQEVAQFERPHWEIAAFNRIGQAYQNLSDAIENAPIPKNLDEDVRFQVQEDFQNKANEVRAKSVEAYRICLERAKAKQWFNEFSDNCEANVAKLDLEYKFTREIRPQPTAYRPSANAPAFIDAPAFKDAIELGKGINDWFAESDKAESVAKAFSEAGQGADAGSGLFNQAVVALRRLDYPRAIDLLSQAEAKDPALAAAPGLKAEILQRTGRAGSVEAIAKALAVEKFQPEALNAQAIAAQAQKDWSTAAKTSRQALIGNAENVNAYQNLARNYFEQGQYQMARLVCEEALKINPKSASIHNLMGLTFLRTDNVRAALRSFVTAVESEPSSVESHLNLASTVLNYADFERAKTHFNGALRVEDGNADGLLGRAVALRGLADFPAARADYDTLFKMQPNNPDLRYNKCLLLAIYEEKYEDALGVCQEFVAMAPETHPKRAEIVKRVEGLKQTIEFMKQEELEKKNAPPAPEAPPAEGEPTTEAQPG
ncbi:MAG: tetratricopeptide repeat protein [Myxococcales bacterium]|nr:tetratricopeptide repeat protein [Myxococcales bacterium]